MPTFYDRVYRADIWINCVDLPEKQLDYVTKALKKETFKQWPSLSFEKEFKKMANQGYAEEVNQPQPFFLNMTLALRVMIEITKSLNTYAMLSPGVPYNQRCNNRIAKDADFERLANQILACNDDITLSQVFDTHDVEGRVVYSINADSAVLARLTNKVIVIGMTEACDVNLTGMNQKESIAAISTILSR